MKLPTQREVYKSALSTFSYEDLNPVFFSYYLNLPKDSPIASISVMDLRNMPKAYFEKIIENLEDKHEEADYFLRREGYDIVSYLPEDRPIIAITNRLQENLHYDLSKLGFVRVLRFAGNSSVERHGHLVMWLHVPSSEHKLFHKVEQRQCDESEYKVPGAISAPSLGCCGAHVWEHGKGAQDTTVSSLRVVVAKREDTGLIAFLQKEEFIPLIRWTTNGEEYALFAGHVTAIRKPYLKALK